MTDREKLIDLVSDQADFLPWDIIEDIADHLIANGVTIVENHVGETVWGIWDVTEYLRKGRKEQTDVQITTTTHLNKALESGAVEIRKKVCTKTDARMIGKVVFLTRAEAEETVRKVCNGKG